MHSKLKLTLTALAVSFALTACKSGGESHVVAKNDSPQAVEIKEKPAKPTEPKKKPETETKKPNQHENAEKTEQPKENTTMPNKATEPSKTEEKQPAEQPKPVESQPSKPDTPSTSSNAKEVNEDNSGKLWRAIPVAENASLNDTSDARREYRSHFVLPDSEEDSSPFTSNEDGYNYYLTLDLGKNEKNDPSYQSLLKAGESYLGLHNGTFNDAKLEGKEIVVTDGDVTTQDAKKIHYLYVNQPYSSYGSIFTNENDSNLFNVRLTTGRDGKKQVEEGSGSSYSEYGVFDIVDGKGRWKEGLTGDATYKGSVIARVEKNVDGEAVATTPAIDGDVTLKVHLNNDWHKSALSGTINSSTLGKIELNENNLVDARYLREAVTFNGETTVQDHPHLTGYYSADLVGEKLNDAVGSIEIETEKEIDNGITKYNAVFGGTKQ